MSRNRMFFDPESIETDLKLNPPVALRTLADAIEAGLISLTLASVVGNGFTRRGDDRVHVIARIGLAAKTEFYEFEARAALPATSLPALAESSEKGSIYDMDVLCVCGHKRGNHKLADDDTFSYCGFDRALCQCESFREVQA